MQLLTPAVAMTFFPLQHTQALPSLYSWQTGQARQACLAAQGGHVSRDDTRTRTLAAVSAF